MLSIWESSSFHSRPQLVVVGGGIVGLFTALFYKRAHPQHHVLVLEKGRWPSGASVKNAGFACFGSPSELIADIRTEGEIAALDRVEMRWQGLCELRQELGDAVIGFERTGGHEVFAADDPLYTQVLEKFDDLNSALKPILGAIAYRWDHDLIRESGLGNVAFLARTELEGALNSGALVSSLLRKAISEGVLFRGSAPVLGLMERNGQVEIDLGGSELLVTDQAVVATNGYTASLLPDVDVVPGRGQVILTDPIPGLQLKGTFHYGEGYYYFRDFAGGVLFGGGRDLDRDGEATTEEGSSPVIQETLERLLSEMILPQKRFTIARRWSGIMGFGRISKTPLIEFQSERILTAVRLGGMGVAIGIKVARQAAEMLR